MSFINGLASSHLTQDVGAGIGNMQTQDAQKQLQQAPAQMDAQMPVMNQELGNSIAGQDANNPELQAALHPMADPNHPVWGVMSQAAGAPPAAGSPIDGMAVGGPVTAGPLPANFGGARGYQKGGVAQGMPVGPNSGVVPASTEGQVLTMEDGGSVPTMGVPASGYNMMGVPGQGAPAMSGRAAGISAGLAPGMAMGHNLMEQYQQSQARSSQDDAFAAEQKADMNAYRRSHGLPTTDEQESGGGLMGTVHGYVDHVLHMFHEKSLDDSHQPNKPMEGSPNYAQPGAVQAVPPSPAGSPAPGVQGAPAAQAAPQNPSAQAGVKAAVGAQQATGDQQQAATSATAVAAAVSDPAAKQGIPQQSPAASGKKAFSLTDSDWEDMEQAKFRAARSAAKAGMDGTQVYRALSAMQTSHFQGQYVKNLGAAQQALAKGDYDGMEAAMKAASYYLPNGKELDLHKATAEEATKFGTQAGTPIVENPFFGMPGHEKDPQMVPITPYSLQNMATAALDPRAFNSELLGQYKAGVEAKTGLMKAQAAQTLAGGKNLQGQAAMRGQNVNEAMAPTRMAAEGALADQREAFAAYYRSRQANTGGGIKIKPSDWRAAQNDGAKAFDEAAQGELTAQPALVMDPATGKPATDPQTGMNIPNPRANTPFRDPTKVSPLYHGLTPQERESGAQIASEINGANQGHMNAREAADVAARVLADQRAEKTSGKQQTHINPKTHKEELNVVRYADHGKPAMRIWADGHYLTVWTTPNMDIGEGAPAIDTGGGAGGGGSASQGGAELTPEEHSLME